MINTIHQGGGNMFTQEVTAHPASIEEIKRQAKADMLKKVIAVIQNIEGRFDPQYDNLVTILELSLKDEV
jgi:hypothetical protein